MREWIGGASLLLGLIGSVQAGDSCPPEQAHQVRIGKQAFMVEVAATPDARERGLSGRDRLAPGAGLWFVLPRVDRYGFWMRGMRFPLDLIWVGPDNRVAGTVTLPICAGDPCPIAYPPAAVAYVLEVNAGRFSGGAGERVDWRCPQERATLR